MNCNEIYDDLPQFDIASDIEKVRNENEILHQRIVQLEEEVSNLSKTIVNLKKIQQNLATNISELYKTALCEINRKNQIINDLRTQLDDVIFRRQNNDKKMMRFYENKRSRSPSMDSRSTKKFKIERSNSKDCDRYRYKVSPRKLIRRNVEKTHHRHGDRESSKDSRTSRDKEQDKMLAKRRESDAVSDNKKGRLEDRQQNDDNFLKTANSKGNIYKKDLFQDQNLSVNNNNNTKRSEKRKIDVVTKKLFDKAEQAADKTEKVDEKDHKKKNIEDEKEIKLDKSQNNKEKSTNQTKIVESNSANIKSEIKIVRQIFNEAILNNKTMLQLSENGKYKTSPVVTTNKMIENTKIDNKSDKTPLVREKIKHKKDKKLDKNADRKSIDKNINKKSVDRETRIINNETNTKIIDEIVKNKKEKIFDGKLVEKKKISDKVSNNGTKIEEISKETIESKKQDVIVNKSPIKGKILDKTPVDEAKVEIDKISKESSIENKKHDEVVDKSPIKVEISDKTVLNESKVEVINNISEESLVENEDKDTISNKTNIDEINGISNESITEKKPIEKSLEDKINEMFNSPSRNDVKSIENEQSTNLNEINEYSIKECVVQLNSNDVVELKDDNVDNTKTNEFKTPLKDTNSINISGRILRSAKKKIFNMECVEEETAKPPVSSVKATKLKRGRPRKNSAIQQANIEIINEDTIPVLHIIESPIELTNVVELTPPSIDNSTIVTTPQSIEEENSKLSVTNCINSSTDSNVSNRGVKKQRRRCVIKMID